MFSDKIKICWPLTSEGVDLLTAGWCCVWPRLSLVPPTHTLPCPLCSISARKYRSSFYQVSRNSPRFTRLETLMIVWRDVFESFCLPKHLCVRQIILLFISDAPKHLGVWWPLNPKLVQQQHCQDESVTRKSRLFLASICLNEYRKSMLA